MLALIVKAELLKKATQCFITNRCHLFAEAVAASYQQSTNESVAFSKVYMGKSGGTADMHEVPEETLDGSLTCKS